MDELVIDNLVYIPSKRAAAITGYAKDYIGQLCREGRIEAKLVGRSWYVLESSIRKHRFGKPGEATTEVVPVAAIPTPDPKEEVVTVASPTSEPEAQPEVTAGTWESPVYVSEPVAEIIPSRTPTSLENTEQEEISSEPASQLQEVQDAWQEWFSKNEGVVSSKVRTGNIVQEAKEESPAAEEEAQERSTAVRISKNVPGSMDIAPRAQERQEEGYIVSERRTRRRKPRALSSATRLPSRSILQAAFIAIIVITLAVTVISTGALEAINPTWAGTSPAIDFLAGVRNIEK